LTKKQRQKARRRAEKEQKEIEERENEQREAEKKEIERRENERKEVERKESERKEKEQQELQQKKDLAAQEEERQPRSKVPKVLKGPFELAARKAAARSATLAKDKDKATAEAQLLANQPQLLSPTKQVRSASPTKQPRAASPTKQTRDLSPVKQTRAPLPSILTRDESPSKGLRAQSRSNVSAKIRSATPAPVSGDEKLTVKALQQDPVTPVKLKRPALNQQTSSTVTPQTQPATTQLSSFATPVTLEYGRSHGLVPRTVRPVTLPRPNYAASVTQPTTPTPAKASVSVFTSPIRQPATITIRPSVERHLHSFNKLISTFPEDAKWLVAPRQLMKEDNTTEGIHVFVDASNIMIGFKDMLRNYGIPLHDMAFDSLALLLERRRPVAKRVFAGSHREANPLPHIKRLVETSKAVGYESILQEQVFITREDSEKKKFFNDVKKLGWHKATQLRSSGSGSDSETGAPAVKSVSAPKWVEQGVDEILHLKMCQSILDTEEPSTMVLATGDGAEAEMSDGFLAHVERALKRGWKVELISWRQQTNGGYRNKKFRTKWGDQFRIIELDEFVEDLIDTA
jgi:hypothetical protein